MGIAIIDCFSGISGDMTLAALIDCGVPQKYLREELAKLRVSGWRLTAGFTKRHSISARKVHIRFDPKNQPRRKYNHIISLIEKSGLNRNVKDNAIKAFTILGEAEARIHRVPLEQVHFHEVGAVDSIIDLVGTFISFDFLGVEKCYSIPVPLGSGFTKTEHGTIPVPSPAALKILHDYPVVYREAGYEMTTPTGATIIKTLCRETVPADMRYKAVKSGYGAGSFDSAQWPNLLRITLAESLPAEKGGALVMIETNIDDMIPEMYSYLLESLFSAGALDVFYTSVMMKKNRPGTLVSVLCQEQKTGKMEEILFKQSTTIGVRKYKVDRTELPRKQKKMDSEFGRIDVKMIRIGSKWMIRPEYETCKMIALKYNLSLPEVYRRIEAMNK